jgi:hypothetical protein
MSERFGFVGGDAVGRLGDLELIEHGREEFAVLGDLDALRRSADDVDPVFLQSEREVERSLAAELGDGAPALLPLVDVEDIFEGQRARRTVCRWCRSRSKRFPDWN